MKILDLIAQTIYDKKGFNILALDMRVAAVLADYVMIAEGNTDRQLQAVAQAIIKELMEQMGERPLYVDGLKSNSNWIVLDYGEIVVHLLLPDMREKYRLEELWPESTIIDLNIKVEK